MVEANKIFKKNFMEKGIIVIGAGGHSKVCIEILQSMGETVSFCLGNAESSDKYMGIPVLEAANSLAFLKQAGYSRAFIAVGSNSLRSKLAQEALGHCYQLVNAISLFVIIPPSVQLGLGIAIIAGAVINSDAKISNLAIVNTGVIVDHDCQVGEAAHVAPQSALAGNVAIGAQSFFGLISKIIPRINIGSKIIVGAGSVIISNIKDQTTVVGVPARIIKSSKDETCVELP